MRGTRGDPKQGAVSLHLQEAGQSQPRTTAAIEMRLVRVRDLKRYTRDIDPDGFEEMTRSCQADKWQVGGLQVEKLAYGKKPRHETADCVQRSIRRSGLTGHKM